MVDDADTSRIARRKASSIWQGQGEADNEEISLNERYQISR